MIPPRFAPVAFAFLLSGIMSLLVSGVATFRAAGLAPDFPALWGGAWLSSWALAFPIVLVVAPAVRRLVERMTRKPA
ncbi:DUF2798 domain-containing protein [Pseudoponticoccus marisrubri]|uniref:GNAT family acetyltransferase n=1 Tax=Pseudoponticoccus marisrubri TaxID=1685382 RepID=A0A0W7WJC6_9RHOB|nr:DUF2798 domain-containing protein [Pseudoponticoccus marisrubri]KUF10639.1 hypothetical protein AVJ23_12265 [Pseudoponticoccus marisrubri]